MSGSEIFGPLLRAGLVDLDHFFAKCKFYICSYGVKFFWCIFQVFLPPKLVVF